MHKLKIGDVCEVIPGEEEHCGCYHENYRGFKVRITTLNTDGSIRDYDIINSDGVRVNGCNCFGNEHLKLVNKFNSMGIKDSFALAFKAEPEKSFRKTGITNGDDFLTEDGQHIFLSWLLKKHGEEFKKDVVDGLLVEMEKKQA